MYKLHTAAQTRDTARRTPHTHHTFVPVDLTAPKVAAGKNRDRHLWTVPYVT